MNEYVIWSFKHKMWWRENRAGYTSELSQAGVYNGHEAGDIVTGSTFSENASILLIVAEKFGAPTVEGLWGAKSPR